MPVTKLSSLGGEVVELFSQLRETAERFKESLEDVDGLTNSIDDHSEASTYSRYIGDTLDRLKEFISSDLPKAEDIANGNREDDEYMRELLGDEEEY